MTYIFDPARYAGLPLDIVHREIGDQIERMIEYLDNLDPWDEREEENEHGDPLEGRYGEGDELDFGECDGRADDEPSLGWTGQVCQIGSGFHGGAATVEYQVDLEGDLSDSEPWLGWTVSGNFGNTADLEENSDEQGYSGSGPVPDESTELCWHPQGGSRIAQDLLRRAGLHSRPTVQLVEIVSSTGQRAMLEITL